ncbi:cellulose synthase/poly-beta-1,6-N-acetylglucosamine synthase-like glycosyltransferase [Saccharothrix tamanrassetensis]|uniref:Cellulose synthase/poly-beta-1,6-N-acetylglucosamine synthase-like glycosyltransferase n=1 Tax=Saccharothrix tamanrassetensis TaxID=1051531 RepID=A0A841CKC1_9PSEU|nr:glycosyltransferase [Saccharothrix tamanrassetensis]MBB5957403.1 cellulose synthase/poly-beta-1,6-N-acetylglucosamine synthase-like glycosyltransferase [Saccharothrix tamanrassetensis]
MGKWGALGAAVTLARAAWTVRTWQQVQRLPRTSVDAGSVTVVVPARDEEANIDRCLTGLRGQDYPHLRIVVVDDASTDRTAQVVRRHAAEDPRVRLVTSAGPPSGWAGKVHAMHLGAEAAESEWLLFVDADTEAAPDLVGRLLAATERDDVDLVSTAGRSTTVNAGWWLLLPPTNVLLFESTSVDGSRGKALAVGHCILVSRTAYDQSGGWRAIAGTRADDVAFATLIRDTGGRTRYVDGTDSLTTAGLSTFGETYRSMRKSLVAGTSMYAKGPASAFLALGGAGLAQIAYGLVPVVTTLRGSKRGTLAWLGHSLAHWAYLRRVRQPEPAALLGPLSTVAFGVLMLDAAWHALRGGATWKGRDVRG